ncbi:MULTISPECIES: pyridoxamine 5'-phosphate oxidase family protein [Polyangium]|nr:MULTISPECIES: pyridoxamine 5'-phosphate oxidase family protein [Polyangium]MDI3285511.1 pyridoxamine 5'-phosphate oxidase family protein [Polyangium sp. 15x6]
MVGKLSPDEIERVLGTQMIAHLGCHAGGRTYVVPITYAYEDDYVYSHTSEGLKLAMMRENPEVCVEVEKIDGPAHWRSVIAWGTFEELTGRDAAHALQVLLERYFSREASETARGPLGPHRQGAVHPDAHLYRIHLTEKTGRFEDGARKHPRPTLVR